LLLFSGVFYLGVNKQVSIFIFISTIISYAVSIYNGFANEKIEFFDDKKIINRFQFSKKIAILIALIIEIGILFIFKYYNFFVANINNYYNKQFEILSVVIPLGISFYTFQTLGYCIDVYRDSYKPQKNFFKYMLFSIFFLQILQGPIGRYDVLSVELYKEHKADYKRIMFGFQRIGWGLFKKLVIADRAGILINNVLNNYLNYAGYEIIITIVLYAIMIYADFSAYMDIVLGMGQILDIKLSENFNTPYFSKTIPEFWRRWHITLNTWFKDYLFYPLLRSKLLYKIGRYNYLIAGSIALFIVWLTTGLWHGAGGNYVLWGVYFGILMILSMIFTPLIDNISEKLKINRNRFSYKLFQCIRTFSLVCIGYMLFATGSFEVVKSMIVRIFNNNLWIFLDGSLFEMGIDGKDLFVLVVSVVVLLNIEICNYKGIDVRERLAQQGIVFRWSIYYLLIFCTIIFGVYGPEYDDSSFIYMGF